MFNTWDAIEHNGAQNRVYQTISHFFEKSPPTFSPFPFSFYNNQQMYGMLSEAGFRNIHLLRVRKEGSCRSAAEAAIGFLEGTPAYNTILERDPKLPLLIRDAAAQAIGDTYGHAPLKTPLQAWVGKAVK